ncbi:hypothetical protein FF38_02047 [Lucilia cuprina]|uniref:Kazal-like domain-containing protein n=1 Tax=Lucilia cuprina TaxID=7375 RepID=A0A0L0BW79_LUCCU|nr:hypothetical protein CVS40_9969 [Lucilia cuprina]KNC24282.1 hypothetical protein FF38_02047 [Lucilia cuprina]
MQFATICVLLLFGLFFCIMGEPKCNKSCPGSYDPICVSIKILGKPIKCTFMNKCTVEAYMCENDLKKLERKPGSCGVKFPQCIGVAGKEERYPLVLVVKW